MPETSSVRRRTVVEEGPDELGFDDPSQERRIDLVRLQLGQPGGEVPIPAPAVFLRGAMGLQPARVPGLDRSPSAETGARSMGSTTLPAAMSAESLARARST